jgi:hypothetical protein
MRPNRSASQVGISVLVAPTTPNPTGLGVEAKGGPNPGLSARRGSPGDRLHAKGFANISEAE